jgi:hypothetical protein
MVSFDAGAGRAQRRKCCAQSADEDGVEDVDGADDSADECDSDGFRANNVDIAGSGLGVSVGLESGATTTT